MKRPVVILLLLALSLFSVPAFAVDTPRPESITEKMSFKLVRGVTNVATAIVEIPKQTYITTRNHGPIGYAVGPIKGFCMALYRGVIGVTESVFFMVPQPGYYDPMIDPIYVWQGWDDVRGDKGETPPPQAVKDQKSGE